MVALSPALIKDKVFLQETARCQCHTVIVMLSQSKLRMKEADRVSISAQLKAEGRGMFICHSPTSLRVPDPNLAASDTPRRSQAVGGS